MSIHQSTIEKMDLIFPLLEQGMSNGQISKVLNIPVEQVYYCRRKFLIKYELPVLGISGSNKFTDNEKNKFIYEQHSMGRSFSDIGKEVGLSKQRCFQIYKKFLSLTNKEES